MHNKILIICGPTATGKTSLGIRLAKKFNGEILSADSRQIYKRMDIGTGKEFDPENKVKIWGYDLISPKEEFSVSHFVKFANGKIKDILDRGKLPIIVGGTGFYIKGVIDGFETVGIPKNEKLREMLEKKTSEELFEMLSNIDSFKSASMNHSDKNNKRRLVRAIEISTWLLDNPNQKEKSNFEHLDKLFVGLKSETLVLNERINQSVNKRLENGIILEIEKLIKDHVSWEAQSMQSLGYRQFRDFFEIEEALGVVVDEWKREEKKYVKRQLTWFNKDKRINWFDTRSENLYQDIESLIEQWHNS